MNVFSPAIKRILIGAGIGLSFGIPDALLTAAHSHGAHGGGSAQDLDPGEYRVRPVITIEGHGGFENNLVEEGKPEHYAIDGLFGVVFEWGLENGGSFAVEAQVGPALVWGEAEHFYGLVHEHGHEEITMSTKKRNMKTKTMLKKSMSTKKQMSTVLAPPIAAQTSKDLCSCAMSPTRSWPCQPCGSLTTSP